MKFSEKEKEYQKIPLQMMNLMPILGNREIMIIGCGGARNDTVNRLYNIGIEGAETICVNTDKQHLDDVRADKKILVGKTLTRGWGGGGYPETGRKLLNSQEAPLKKYKGCRSSFHHCRSWWRYRNRCCSCGCRGGKRTGSNCRRNGI